MRKGICEYSGESGREMYVGRVKEEGGRGELEEEDGYQQML